MSNLTETDFFQVVKRTSEYTYSYEPEKLTNGLVALLGDVVRTAGRTFSEGEISISTEKDDDVVQLVASWHLWTPKFKEREKRVEFVLTPIDDDANTDDGIAL